MTELNEGQRRYIEMLQRTAKTPEVIDRLQKTYGDTEIDRIGRTDNFMQAMAVLASTVMAALDDAGVKGRKAKRMTLAMLNRLMGGGTIMFMLGYDEAKREPEWDGGLKEIGL